MCTTLLYMLFGLAAIIVLAADISLHFPRPGNSQIKWVFQNTFKLYLKVGIPLFATVLRPEEIWIFTRTIYCTVIIFGGCIGVIQCI